MSYLDLSSIHNPSSGTSPPATWGDQVRDNFEHLLLRGPYICTSSTRPSPPFEGMTIIESDTDKQRVYNGTTWITTAYYGAHDTWTPTFAQGTSTNISKTLNVASYTQLGFKVTCTVGAAFTSNGQGTTVITMTLPVARGTYGSNVIHGIGGGYFRLGATGYMVIPVIDSTAATNIIKFIRTDATASNYLGAAPAANISAGNDIMGAEFSYLAATAA